MIPTPALVPTTRTYGGVFFITLATLMFEVLLTRIFSVTMWYHFAFVAISVAMFGLSAGATLVYVFPRFFTAERTKEHMARFALFFALAAIVSFVAHASVPFLPEMSFKGVASIVFTYTVISIPFIMSGVCVCLALTRFPKNIGKVYAADLTGAALGCVLLIYTLGTTDAAGSVFVVAFLASIGAILLGSETQSRWLRVEWIGCVLFLLLACVQTGFVWGGHPLLHLVWFKGERKTPSFYEKWNSFSRIRVFWEPGPLAQPFGWGLSAKADPKLTADQLGLDIDASAFTVMTRFNGDFKPLEYLKYDVTNMAYQIRPRGKVLIVGAGGGRDVLSALSFGEKSVLAVELNPDILKTLNGRYGDFTGHLDRIPNVTFVNDEARSYIARSHDTFNVIQISMIDTWAATTSGAFVFSENTLYTLEAWRSFIRHLTPHGVLSVSRWSFQEESGEVYRVTALAGAALRQQGIDDVRDHLIIVRRNGPRMVEGIPLGIATILVSRQPFSNDDLDKVEAVCSQKGFDVLLSPRYAADPTYAKLAAGDIPQQTQSGVPVNLSPPTDNQPFFFFTLRAADLWNQQFQHLPAAAKFDMNAMFVVAVLFVTVVALTILCILLPLFLASGEKRPLSGGYTLLAFFAAIGFGFIMIELSQMQRLMIFLGHPSYALSVVLFVLLLSSGAGSFVTERLLRNGGENEAFIVPLLPLLFVLCMFGPLTPHVLANFASSTTPMRIFVAGAILAPLGFFMGMPFPIGMRYASSKSPALTPWLWGVNGATSVCGSVLSAIIAVGAGISAAYWSGVFCYFVALAALASVKVRSLDSAERPAWAARMAEKSAAYLAGSRSSD